MRLFKKLMVIILVLLFTGCAGRRATGPTGEQTSLMMKREITRMVQIPYLLYLPEKYDEQQNWPLMLFLHGAGERGTDINKVKLHGPPKLIEQGQDFPFIIVSPQCPDGVWWSVENLDLLLKEITKDYKVDASRIYVTGLSMGGFATWDLALAYPNRFAAIAPVCGGADPERICALKELPIWVFHGAKDRVVPVERSKSLVNALKACGGDVRFTVYPEANHDSWTETYNNPELYEWFLKHKRSPVK